jgi:ComF family protein
MSEQLKKAKDFILELIFPTICLVCGHEDKNWVCAKCDLTLAPKDQKVCPVCLKTPEKLICAACRKESPLSSLNYCYSYDDKKIARLIHALKYRNIQDLALWFAKKMQTKVSYYPFNNSWVIVPVPLHWMRLNERGYNQAELLARALSEKLHIPLANDVLIKSRYTKTQTKFSKEERAKNLLESFRIKNARHIQSKNILLIDDVATTLATLETCAEALKGAGAINVWALTIARAE